MEKYEVLHEFVDMKGGIDGAGIWVKYSPTGKNKLYPIDGVEVVPERVALLQSAGNAQGKPLIAPYAVDPEAHAKAKAEAEAKAKEEAKAKADKEKPDK